MSNISPSSIKTDAALEEKLKSASFEEIKEIMKSAAIAQKLVVPDPFDSAILHETPAGTAPRAYAKTITVNGVKTVLEGSTEEGLVEAELAFFRETLGGHPVEPSDEPAEQPRNAQGQFVSADDAVAQAELSLRLRRGEISADQYIIQSGSIDRYLQSRGVDVEQLAVQTNPTASKWNQAVSEFVARHPMWSGGQQSRVEMAKSLEALGLADNPSVASLEAAYLECQKSGTMEESREFKFEKAAREATSYSELQQQTHHIFGTR